MARTRLGLYGGPRQPYGAFDPKTAIIPAKGRVTRLGLYGGPRGVYGAFDGKTEGDAVSDQYVGFISDLGRMMNL